MKRPMDKIGGKRMHMHFIAYFAFSAVTRQRRRRAAKNTC